MFSPAQREARLADELSRQADLSLRITGATASAGMTVRRKSPRIYRSKPVCRRSTTTAPTIACSTPRSTRTNPTSPQLTLLLDITHHQHFLQRMQHLIWLTVGLSALATALLGAWAARSGLRPLRRMSAVARGISAQSLNARLPEAQMPPELAEMAHSFNAMLARLDDSFQRLSAFSADIAHELRTPLSNLLTHTQVTLTRPRPIEDYREALHSNLEELQWMAQLVNDMLYLAKADHGLLMPKREPLELADESGCVAGIFCAVGGGRRGQAES